MRFTAAVGAATVSLLTLSVLLAVFDAAQSMIYVVQTATKALEVCIIPRQLINSAVTRRNVSHKGDMSYFEVSRHY